MDIGGHVVLVVSLYELETLKRGLVDTANTVTPDRSQYEWRRAAELLGQMPVPFKCESFVMAGPGHQSKHECEIESIHDIGGEHHDSMYEWEGTSSYEMVEQPWEFRQVGPEDMNIPEGETWASVDGYLWRRTADAWETKGPPKRRLKNVPHHGGHCC